MWRAEPGKTPLQRCTEQSTSPARKRGNGSASSGSSPEWMRRAGEGRDEASAAALRLLLAVSSASAPSPPAATPSPTRPQSEPKPTRSQTHPPLPNCCRRVLPTRKETTQVAGSKQALSAKNERKRKPQSREVGKLRPGLPHPPPSCKMRLRPESGRGGWVPPYLLSSQDRSSGRSRAARAPRSGKCLPHAAIPSARSAVAHTRALARPPPGEGDGVLPPHHHRSRRPPRCSAPAAEPAPNLLPGRPAEPLPPALELRC